MPAEPHLLHDAVQGTTVNIIIITNGDKGCSAAFCQNFTSDEIAATRRVEAIAAAAALGVQECNVSGHSAQQNMDVGLAFMFHCLCRCTCSATKTEAWRAPTTTM